ncbi:MAG TPA: FAD-binding oxidoreductase [Candidatus Nanopelagicales bacterium]|nr:FAD-binding oxidoreductase [Candidatus Nanopelagicales bacterium]
MTELSSLRTVDAPHGGWQRVVVREVSRATPGTVVLRVEVEHRVAHMPGQRVVVRLTAADGYQASRSYSIASAPGDDLIELCVERVDDGEVSTHLVDVVQPGDEVELRGPVGGWFVWDGRTPALAIGGGTGVVPLVSMLRHARALGIEDRICLVGAGRTLETLPYAGEIAQGCSVLALSQQVSPTGRPAARLGRDDLLPHLVGREVFFVCGSARFAEAASQLLVDLGVAPARIRIERFGTT